MGTPNSKRDRIAKRGQFQQTIALKPDSHPKSIVQKATGIQGSGHHYEDR